MRLTPVQVNTILTEVAEALGDEARVWLYGSRLQDGALGGDVDLLIEVAAHPRLAQLAVLRDRLEDLLALPCDVQVRVASEPPTAFQALVAQRAVRLEVAA
ncbi:MAG: nucleotidyltransferase domain-containing protein [Candidatus Sericytochromatia bacterium]|nr:nucleotidyltransferase domain-containing protein [Candidatus Sericytochromatia bacterium]